MTENEVKFHCPRCKAELKVVVWGNGWDVDYTGESCENCGYAGPLETMTGYDPDGSVYQNNVEEDEE